VKFLFVTNRYFPHILGGAEVTVQTLAEELRRRGHLVTVVSISATQDDVVSVLNEIRIYRLAVRNLYNPFQIRQRSLMKLLWHLGDAYNLSGGRQVGRILDLERPDFVSTHNLGGLSVAVWDQVRSRGIRLIHTLHDYYLLCPKTTMFKHERNCETQCVACRILSMPKRNRSDSVDVVIGISRFVMNAHVSRGFFASAKQAVIYNSRKLTCSLAGDSKSDSAHSGPLRFGYFGRIETQKGIARLLSALSEMTTNDWLLRVAGRASDPGYIDQLRRKFILPQVEYLGFLSAEDFFPTIDVLVVPSLWNEPLGVVAFEAWGFGVPVIVSARGGLAEIVDPDTGWVFEPESKGALLRTLRAVVDSRKILSSMRRACLRRREYFVPERQANEFLAAVLEPQKPAGVTDLHT
jgi:glycosyltransferase involved in cell wall biosynthesis